MKSTLKRELKKAREIVEREALAARPDRGRSTGLAGRLTLPRAGQHRWGRPGKGPGNVALRGVIARGAIRPAPTEAGAPLGCWLNGRERPVLKHGPRSRLIARVFGCQTRTRNESERRWELRRTIDRS